MLTENDYFHIFKYLSPADLLVAQLVSSSWRRLCTERHRQLHTVSYPGPTLAILRKVFQLEKCAAMKPLYRLLKNSTGCVTALSLGNLDVYPSNSAHLPSIDSLKEFFIRVFNLAPNLVSVSLNVPLTGKLIYPLSTSSHPLRELHINCAQCAAPLGTRSFDLDGFVITMASAVPMLESLALVGVNIHSSILETYDEMYNSPFSSLLRLKIAASSVSSLSGLMRFVSQLNNLTHLKLFDVLENEADEIAIPDALPKSLVEIGFRGNWSYKNTRLCRLRELFLAAKAGRWPNLSKVALNNLAVTDAVLKQAAVHLPSLTSLRIARNSCRNVTATDWAAFRTLRQLDLSYTSIISNEDCSVIAANLLELQTVELTGSNRSNLYCLSFQTTLNAFLGLEHLRNLVLAYVNFSDDPTLILKEMISSSSHSNCVHRWPEDEISITVRGLLGNAQLAEYMPLSNQPSLDLRPIQDPTKLHRSRHLNVHVVVNIKDASDQLMPKYVSLTNEFNADPNGDRPFVPEVLNGVDLVTHSRPSGSSHRTNPSGLSNDDDRGSSDAEPSRRGLKRRLNLKPKEPSDGDNG